MPRVLFSQMHFSGFLRAADGALFTSRLTVRILRAGPRVALRHSGDRPFQLDNYWEYPI